MQKSFEWMGPVHHHLKILSCRVSWLPVFFLAMVFSGNPALGQADPATRLLLLEGSVQSASGEPLIGATILVEETGEGVATGADGAFRLLLPGGSYRLKVSFVGYEPKVMTMVLESDQVVRITLELTPNLLNEVEVTDLAADDNVSSMDIGVNKLTVRSIQEIPTLLGQVDILRSLQTLPGVTTVGEGATGFNVRGGNIDQNLVLLDEAPIFNSSHLMGLFSVFNPDAVRDMTFFRGGIPAQYGGRAASVLDIRLKDPNATRFGMQGGIGMTASRLAIEGPILRERLGVMIAGRLAYPEYLFRLLPDPATRETRAGFYDLTAKLKYQPGRSDQLELSAYFSRDRFKIAGDSLTSVEVNASSTLFRWQSAAASLRWDHFFGERFSTALIGAWSDYQPGFEIPDEAYAAQFQSGVRYAKAKAEGRYFHDRHDIRLGGELLFYQIAPGSLAPDSELSAINPVTLQDEQGRELGLYLSGEWKISEQLGLMYGLRYSHFTALGPATVYQYAPGEPRDPLTVTDSTVFGSGDVIRTFGGLEPRFALRVGMGPSTSLKVGYNRMRQYIQLVSNTTAALPTDRWKISDTYVEPQVSDQVSAGIFRNFSDNALETSLEVFYKEVENMPDFRSGANLLLLENPETAILQGDGRSYGVEVLIRKKTGPLTGWVSYTFSRSELRINSSYPEDAAFSGEYYPANFDRPHVLNVIANYRLGRRIGFSASFNFSSGRPVTYPEGKYFVGGVYIPNYLSRNDNRIPDYHRLDLGMTIYPDERPGKRWKGRWTFSFYNVYARKNAYSIYFRTVNGKSFLPLNQANAYRLAIIGTMVPSISYDFTF